MFIPCPTTTATWMRGSILFCEDLLHIDFKIPELLTWMRSVIELLKQQLDFVLKTRIPQRHKLYSRGSGNLRFSESGAFPNPEMMRMHTPDSQATNKMQLEAVLMRLVPGAKDQDPAGLRPPESWSSAPGTSPIRTVSICFCGSLNDMSLRSILKGFVVVAFFPHHSPLTKAPKRSWAQHGK